MEELNESIGINESIGGVDEIINNIKISDTSENKFEDTKKPKDGDLNEICILVATPAFNSMMYSSYSMSMKNLQIACRERDIRLEYGFTYNESLITRARNNLCDLVMQDKKYTHILFIDGDIEFEEDDIFKMLEFNQPIVGGAYPKKSIKWDKLADFVNQKHKSYVSIDDIKKLSRDIVYTPISDEQDMNIDFVEVKYTGTGIMLVQRHVLEKMQEAYPNDYYEADDKTYFRFFDVGLKYIEEAKKNIYLSEDYWFCERWRELGEKIHLYTKMRCKHWGSLAY